MVWCIVIFSIFMFLVGIYCGKWHSNLNRMLDHRIDVNYIDYLLSAYGAYLLIPASTLGMVTGICLLI